MMEPAIGVEVGAVDVKFDVVTFGLVVCAPDQCRLDAVCTFRLS
jgi:hypothetical protein